MKNSFDLNLKEEKSEEVYPNNTITTYSRLCTITVVGCQDTGSASPCGGTSFCDTEGDCTV